MRVRPNATYVYNPVGWDRADPPQGVRTGDLKPMDIVRVTNLHGCPKANTMGMCHITHPETGKFLGLVCTGSLNRK